MKVSLFQCKSLVVLALMAVNSFSQSLTMWFPPGSDGAKSKAITVALSANSGLTISPRIAVSYSEIYREFASKKEGLVYAGSFAGAALTTLGVITPLVQKIDGKELYCGVLVYPKTDDPVTILSTFPAEISFATGASSGESSAKAATAQKANVGVKDHLAAANAVKAGKARAAVVKNYWWDANKDKFP
jgi:ABC-type phosphate/phosphonate transport system substrate-binding protein